MHIIPDTPHPPAAPLPFDGAWIVAGTANALEVDSALVVAGVPATRSSAEQLVELVGRIDLTSLNADDTASVIRTLCERARDPLAGTGVARMRTCVAAVCVHPYFLPLARNELDGSGVRIAVVAGGFPAGLSSLRLRVAEVRECAQEGADEIDTVINRGLALEGGWELLYGELCELRDAAGDATLKVILATGELRTLENVARASRVALLAGADFIKTSTGKEAVNATFPAGLVMLRAIRDHHEHTGRRAGFKAAGGIRTTEDALAWTRLVQATLGPAAADASHFRIGASGLLDAIVAQLDGSPPHPPVDAAGY